MTNNPDIKTIDLNFQGYSKAIAAYLIPYDGGAVLVECGPGSTQHHLEKALLDHGYQISDITHLFLTHIHLDHAGAAGWLARQGVKVFVHEVGAPHLKDPSRLLASAGRIYGDKMDVLWGEFFPVPEERLTSLKDGETIVVGNYQFTALDTPGHAYHHLAYLVGETCFSGDIGGVRIPTTGPKHLRIPMPPPEFHITKWRESIQRLKTMSFSRIAPTHFGIYDDVDWHVDEVLFELIAVEKWMHNTFPTDMSMDELRTSFVQWTTERSLNRGLDASWLEPFEQANPSGMSADGIKRYWEKFVNIE